MILTKTARSRKRAFKAALAVAGRTLRWFAEEQGISEGHLHAVLNGTRISNRLSEVIDEFIEQHAPTLAA